MTGQIRLVCVRCEREDFDGIERIPSDWADVAEVQSYADSVLEVRPDDLSRSVLEWWTHIGTCPDCVREEEEHLARIRENQTP